MAAHHAARLARLVRGLAPPMSSIRNAAHRAALVAEAQLDRLARLVGRRFGGDDQIRVQLFRGYGTAARLHVLGRVLEQEPLAPAIVSDSSWRNLLNSYRRLESDEIPGARVLIRAAGAEQEVVADDEGFFESTISPAEQPSVAHLWQEVHASLLEPLRPGHPPVDARGHVLVPPAAAAFGVISDIDDTVVHTGATSLLRMARTVLLGNARTRLPFAGVAAFYRSLQRGRGRESVNPIFYVSSSPWNLYDVLIELFELQNIPLGPVMLRDWGISPGELLPTSHGSHKLAAIRRILNLYPSMPFILIGDSGQEDPEIYRDVVGEFPSRILAAYIRNVTPEPFRLAAIRTLAAEIVDAGSALVLAPDTNAAAEHAANHGWISAADLSDIRDERREDATGQLDEPRGNAKPAARTPPVIVDGSEP